MNKIIYLSTKYLSETDFERAGIYKYLKNKINVEIWYLNKLVAKYYNNKEFRFKKLIIKKISNFEQFENELKKNSFNCIYDLRVAYYFQNKKIFQTLSKYNINYIVHIRGDIHKHKISLKNFIKKIIKGNFTHLKLIFFNLFFLLFSSNFWNIRKAKYACFIGKYGYLKREKHKLIDNQTRFIMGQHRDYDDYLKINSKTLNTKNKKVLFIDSAIPYHPDSKYNIGSSSDVNPEEYYSSIKFFLEKLRKSFDYKIEISCHPRIEIKKLKKHFPNFVIKRKETINQIRYSKLIITHDSNAINFAVLYKKPIIFITNDSLKKSFIHYNYQINKMAKLFNKRSINIDSNSIIDITKQLKINKRVYKNFLNNFIKANGTKKFQADIITERLKKDKIWV